MFAAIGAIINIGSMAAIGYFSNDRNLHDMSRMGGKSGQIRAALNPALKVVKTVSRPSLVQWFSQIARVWGWGEVEWVILLEGLHGFAIIQMNENEKNYF